MAVLAQFPPEIISIICSSLNGFDLAHLWLSGDRMLLTRLEHAVTRFELSLAQTINCNWPKLISQFKRLESLIIRPCSENHRIWFRDVDFYGISSTLKHLELEFDNLEFSLFGLPLVVFDTHPDPIWSPPTEGEMGFSPFPMSTHFPLLETIRFTGNMKFPQLLIPMLPPGLLTLSLPFDTLDAFVMRQLPSSLTRLELVDLSLIEFDEFDLNFPSNMTYLDISSLNLFEWKPSMVSLPPSLTYLAATSEILSLDRSMVSIPSTLVHCVLHGWSPISNDLCICLPPGLRSLVAENQIIPFEIENLPAGLETLAVNSIQGLSPASTSLLPSSLTSVIIGPMKVPPESLLSLPSSLRSLSIRTTLVAMATPYPFMSTLEDLSIATVDAAALDYAPKLKKLEIYAFMPQKGMPLRLANLPSLTDLKIKAYTVNWKDVDVESFPETLQSLEIPFLLPSSYQRLPRGLKCLNVMLYGIDNTCIAHLPPGLNQLTFSYLNDDMKPISDASVALLPRTLTELELNDTSELTDVGISNLPCNLRRCLFGITPLLTNASASLFPRQLRYLELTSADLLSNACVKHLPRSLYHLTLTQSPKIVMPIYRPASPTLNAMVSQDGHQLCQRAKDSYCLSKKEAEKAKRRKTKIHRSPKIHSNSVSTGTSPSSIDLSLIISHHASDVMTMINFRLPCWSCCFFCSTSTIGLHVPTTLLKGLLVRGSGRWYGCSASCYSRPSSTVCCSIGLPNACA